MGSWPAHEPSLEVSRSAGGSLQPCSELAPLDGCLGRPRSGRRSGRRRRGLCGRLNRRALVVARGVRFGELARRALGACGVHRGSARADAAPGSSSSVTAVAAGSTTAAVGTGSIATGLEVLAARGGSGRAAACAFGVAPMTAGEQEAACHDEDQEKSPTAHQPESTSGLLFAVERCGRGERRSSGGLDGQRGIAPASLIDEGQRGKPLGFGGNIGRSARRGLQSTT